MLQKESVKSDVLNLIYAMQEKEYLQDFFLVGGTGLALQIGHRQSDDIDLFTINDFNQEALLEKLEIEFSFNMDSIENNTIKGFIEGIKVDLLSHKYPLINNILEIEDVSIASIDDISAMKVNAISNDGTRVKDFIDLYFLLDDGFCTIGQLLEYYQSKYKLRNPMHAMKSLNYFEDVDISDWPELLRKKEVRWKDMKRKIDKACQEYIQKTM